jgi:hypothetical protein
VFTPSDDTPAAPPVAVLSHHAWQTAYGADRSVLGSSFIIEGHPFIVIGVAPAGFFGETLRRATHPRRTCARIIANFEAVQLIKPPALRGCLVRGKLEKRRI